MREEEEEGGELKSQTLPRLEERAEAFQVI